MKKLYCLVMHDYGEMCGSREVEELHTTNKKRLEDLAVKLNKKVNSNFYYFFVREITPKQHLSRQDIDEGIKNFERYGAF